MDKSRNFLQWGYIIGRFAREPLREGIFRLVAGMQQQGKASALVCESLDYFEVGNSEQFQELLVKLSNVVPVMATAHGTHGSMEARTRTLVTCGPNHGAMVTWPSVFLHVCEAKQVLNALGEDVCRAICRQSLKYVLPEMLGDLMEAGSTD